MTCRKRKFRSTTDALSARRAMRSQGSMGLQPAFCGECRAYHLISPRSSAARKDWETGQAVSTPEDHIVETIETIEEDE